MDCISEEEYGDEVGGAVDRLHYDTKPFSVVDYTQNDDPYGSALPGTVLRFGYEDGADLKNKKMACVATRYSSDDEFKVGGWKEVSSTVSELRSSVPVAGLYFDSKLPAVTGACNMNGDVQSTLGDGTTVTIEGIEFDITEFIPVTVGECAAFEDTTYRYNWTITNATLEYWDVPYFVLNISDDYVTWKLRDVNTGDEYDKTSGNIVNMPNSTYELTVASETLPNYAPASLYSFSIGTSEVFEISETGFRNDFAFASGDPYSSSDCTDYCTQKVALCEKACKDEYNDISGCAGDCETRCDSADDRDACTKDCKDECIAESVSYDYIYKTTQSSDAIGEVLGTGAISNCIEEYCDPFSTACSDSCANPEAGLYFCDSTAKASDLAWNVLSLTRFNSLGANPETKTPGNFGESAYSFRMSAAGSFLMNSDNEECLEDPENCNYCTKSTGEWRSAPLGDNPGHTYAFDQYLHQPTFNPWVSFKRTELLDKELIHMDSIEYYRREFATEETQEADDDIQVPLGQ